MNRILILLAGLLVVGNVYALPPCQRALLFEKPFKDVFHNCIGTKTLSDGSEYVGEWKHGRYYGQGVITIASGQMKGGKYEGGFKDNMYHGQGTFIYPNGAEYIGEFKDGEAHGQGTFTMVDGGKYIGEFKASKMHGQGTWTYYVDDYAFLGVTNGSFLAGEFINNGPLNGGLYSPSGKLITKYKNREAIYVPPLFAPQYEPGAYSELLILNDRLVAVKSLEISKEQERRYLEVLHSPEVEEIRRYLDACLAGEITNPDDLFPCNATMPDGNLMYVPFNHRKAEEVHWTISGAVLGAGRTISEYRTDKVAETNPDRGHPISAIDGSFIVLDFQTSAEWKKTNVDDDEDATYRAFNLSRQWFWWDEYPEFSVDPAIPSDNEKGSVVTIQFSKPPHDMIVVRLSPGDNGKPRVKSFSKPNRPLMLHGGGAGQGGIEDAVDLMDRFRLNTVSLVRRYIDNSTFLSCPSNQPCVSPATLNDESASDQK